MENLAIEGWVYTNNEKINSKWGIFKNLDDSVLTGYFKIKFKNGNFFEGHLI